MCGWIDGAIRSGERAAAEVVATETAAAVSTA
jgi:monoamine oxidase